MYCMAWLAWQMATADSVQTCHAVCYKCGVDAGCVAACHLHPASNSGACIRPTTCCWPAAMACHDVQL
jgi:hypothetical protein